VGARLLDNSYGKSAVRLTKVRRDSAGGRHELIELEVAIALEGDFETAHRRGDNSKVLPTDTMKNTVYALAKDHPLDTIEEFGLHLARHFVSTQPQVSRARVSIASMNWTRAVVQGREHPHCFVKGSEERAVCAVTVWRMGTAVESGFDGLVLLKTTDSAFAGFPRDRYTTLKDTDDRIFATSVWARWEYASSEPDFAGARAAIRTAMLETFAGHHSLSVQQTLYAMGEAALGASAAISRIRISMPNQHRILVDLSPLGLANQNEVFVTTSEPYGLIEATVGRA
jgi:urate oxidase